MTPGHELVHMKRQLMRCGECLASELANFAGRFLLLPEEAAFVLPIWVLHTYVFNAFEFTPYLNIVSPEAGCGKTTTGEVLGALCWRATSPTCGSAAVLRRLIASAHPTLILDEWDSLDRAVRDACKNFLNTGFKKGGVYMVMHGARLVALPTFCPKAIVGRSTVRLAEATLTRCLPVTLHRATETDNLEKFRESHRSEAEPLRQQCEVWAESFRHRQVLVQPSFPEGLDGRQQDICEPLLVIADAIGGFWPHRVRADLVRLLVGRQRHAQPPENELLRAVWSYLQEQPKKEFYSQDFCAWANSQEERPWSDRPLTPTKLAAMLRTYDLFPRQINHVVNSKQNNHRGYLASDFEGAFRRYVAAPSRAR